MTKRAAVYARISRDRVGAGLGVDRQEQDGRELVEKQGWTVAAVYADNDLSAYSGKRRPGYEAMLDDIRCGTIDVVVAWHTDRLHRSPVELEQYIGLCDQRGIPTLTVQAGHLDLATPSGRLVARQLGAVARYEVEHAIERQRRAKAQAADAGKWKGGRRPFGFEPDGVTVRPLEAAHVLQMTEDALRGTSLWSISARLNAAGVRTSTGGEWNMTAVRKVLLRPRNAGLSEHRGTIAAPAQWPAIVPEELWRGVVALLRDPSRLNHEMSARRWLGAGLYLCGVCGAKVRSHGVMSRGLPVRQYACSRRKCVIRDALRTDALVVETIVKRLERPDAVDLLTEGTSRGTADLRTMGVAYRRRMDELAESFADGHIDAKQLRVGTERLRAQLDEVEQELVRASRRSVFSGLIGAPDVSAAWEGLDLDRRRAALATLMTVTLLPSAKGRPARWRPGQPYFRPDTVQILPRVPS